MPCPLCDNTSTWSFCQIDQAPVICNALSPTRERALLVDKAGIELVFCPGCGLIYNSAYDPARIAYTGDYENSLFFSSRFREYARQQAMDLVRTHNLLRKRIVEIGCGNGDFLREICEIGNNIGAGFDPAAPAREISTNVRLVPREFDPSRDALDADLVCCRQVLEHIWTPRRFLSELRRSIGRGGTTLFLEVPNALWMLRRGDLWDVIYEHCAYYTPLALRRVLAMSGFLADEVHPVFGEQFLTVEAVPAHVNNIHPCDDGMHEIETLVRQFQSSCVRNMSFWQERLATMYKNGATAAVWGSGSKGVTFLNALNAPLEVIPWVVDINPRKHGRYIPGAAQRVIPPEELLSHACDSVIVMNPIYIEEISRTLQSLDIQCELLTA